MAWVNSSFLLASLLAFSSFSFPRDCWPLYGTYASVHFSLLLLSRTNCGLSALTGQAKRKKEEENWKQRGRKKKALRNRPDQSIFSLGAGCRPSNFFPFLFYETKPTFIQYRTVHVRSTVHTIQSTQPTWLLPTFLLCTCTVQCCSDLVGNLIGIKYGAQQNHKPKGKYGWTSKRVLAYCAAYHTHKNSNFQSCSSKMPPYKHHHWYSGHAHSLLASMHGYSTYGICNNGKFLKMEKWNKKEEEKRLSLKRKRGRKKGANNEARLLAKWGKSEVWLACKKYPKKERKREREKGSLSQSERIGEGKKRVNWGNAKKPCWQNVWEKM